MAFLHTTHYTLELDKMVCEVYLLLYILPLLATGEFHMTDILQIPPPQQSGIILENSTVSLYGVSSDKWTFSELYFSDKILCRHFSGGGGCLADQEDIPTIRLGGVQVVQGGNGTVCGFQLVGISSKESGKWKIRMGKLISDDIHWDYMEVLMSVSQEATMSLSPLPSSNYLYQNSSYTSHNPGSLISLECTATKARPQVGAFTWGVTSIGHWQVDYGEVVIMGQENTSQVVDMVTNTLGLFTVTCTPIQVMINLLC